MRRTFLILQLKRIGDVLLCTPLLRAIHDHDSAARILFVTETANEPVLLGNPYLKAVITIPARMGIRDWRLLRARLLDERVDVAIDPAGTPRSCAIAALCRAPLRVGFRVRAPRRWIYNRVIIPNLETYTVNRRLDLLRAIGLQDSGLETDLNLDDSDRDAADHVLSLAGFRAGMPIVAIAPTSRKGPKRWFAEGFARVASQAQDMTGGEILLLYGPGEEDQAEEVRRLLPGGCPVLRDAPPLRTAAAMIERAVVLIANDGGLKHLAVALHVPSITIFVSTGPAGWHPPGHPLHSAVLARGDIDAEMAEIRAALERLFGS
jgi:heptosyltransferase III